MLINRFEDIIAWQKSKELAVLVYHLFEEAGTLALKIRYNELRFP